MYEFVTRIQAINAKMKEFIEAFVVEVNDMADNFFKDFKDTATAQADLYLNEMTKWEELTDEQKKDQETPEIVEQAERDTEFFGIISDKEQLIQSVETCKENFDTKMNEIETGITKAITSDWTKIESSIKESQFQRSRLIVEEIIGKAEEFRVVLGKRFSKYRGDDYD